MWLTSASCAAGIPRSGGTPTLLIKDTYQAGRLAYQTDGANTLLATFTYDADGRPSSVQVGSDPATAPRYYYEYNGHGDVVGLVQEDGTPAALYMYDEQSGDFGASSTTENFANGWHNPYRYDGRDRVRYDAETGLYWMSVRAYDPTIGRFISRDPLGRLPLFGLTTQPYAYAGNNPLTNVDPSGQRQMANDLGGYTPPPAQPKVPTTPKPTPHQSQSTLTTTVSARPTTKVGDQQPKQKTRGDTESLDTTKPGPTYSAEQITQGERTAAGIADEAASNLRNMSYIFLGLAGIATAVAGFLFFSGNPLTIFTAGLIAGLALRFLLLGIEATKLADLFDKERGHDLSWYTWANIGSIAVDISGVRNVGLIGNLAAFAAMVSVGIFGEVEEKYLPGVGGAIMGTAWGVPMTNALVMQAFGYMDLMDAAVHS